MLYSRIKTLFAFSFSLMLMIGIQANAQQQQAPPPQGQTPQINENFTDEEYEKFAKVNVKLMPIQQEAQENMVKTIEESGLKVERFQELAQAQQAGTIRDVSEDPEELAKFNQVGQEVMSMQQEVQTQVMEIIEGSDLPQEKFQEMFMAYNQSEKVRSKVDELIKKETDNQ